MTESTSQQWIDPHIHCVSRTTDDYERMAAMGIVAVIEPAFWLGQPRTSVGSFIDYFAMITGWERFRARQFGIAHHCTIGLNSKEANDVGLAKEVLAELPNFASKEGVVAIGEIGYDDQTEAEEFAFREQIKLAQELELPIMVHTPHRDKTAGTKRSMDLCIEMGCDPSTVIIDHNNEETVKEVLDRGFWAAFTIYPKTKMGNERMVEVVRTYGCERIIVDSSADWGVSDPLAVPKTANLMLQRGIDPAHVQATCYSNAVLAYGQSGQFNDSNWQNDRELIDQRQLYQGNSVLRGQEPQVESGEIV